MPPEQIALKFPSGTKTRIRSLAMDGETMTATLLRALGCLERHGTEPHKPLGDPDTLDAIQTQLSDLAARVAALEALGGPLAGSRQDLDPDKAAVLARIQSMKVNGATYQGIADTLNNEGIPTLSGRGQWQAGTIGNLLRAVG